MQKQKQIFVQKEWTRFKTQIREQVLTKKY